MSDIAYRGRFAPSPTGPLHFGSLLAALASALDARRHKGCWLIRIEDVDLPRNVEGAGDDILRTLEAFGFEWDGTPEWQSRRLDVYAAALDDLRRRDLVYACDCSRREIAASGLPAIDGGLVYPGKCRRRTAPPVRPPAWRIKVDSHPVGFDDRLQGRLVQHLDHDVGDFVLQRADGCYTYQLAVVVDDAAAGITDVVRGADLIDSTPRQIWLQSCLDLPTPRYAHLPVATNARGEKLSKQTRAPALDVREAPVLLTRALSFLGQQPPVGLEREAVADIWRWAVAHWDFAAIPRTRGLVPTA